MKNFWLFAVLFAAAGLSIAWVSNYMRFGFRDARLGYMTDDGSINASNVINTVKSGYKTSNAKVEMLTELTHDFGVMAPDEKGKFVFRLKNVGEEPLSLVEGESTCKCTIGIPGDDELAPGAETEIVVEWTVKTNESEFTQSAQIITNDPTNVALNLKITGTVVREIEIVPKKWTIGDVASGEPFEVKGTVYSYYRNDIKPGSQRFSSEQMNELAEFDIEEFKPTEEDGANAKARQGFHITAKVKGGMRQGAVSTRFLFGFQQLDEDGNVIKPEDEEKEDEDLEYFSSTNVSGRIVGNLSMIVGTKVQSQSSGGYIYKFGRLDYNDSKKGKAFIVLKGSEREATKLTIGEVNPAEAIQAKLGKPLVRETQVLYPLELEIIPGDKPYDLTGHGSNNYGTIWIESDNPKVTKMLIAVQFAVDAK